MKYLVYIFFISALLCSFSYGQTDFRSGYIITNNHDTISGLIDYRGEVKNSRVCHFKKDSVTDENSFLPGEIFAYRFLNGKYYISKEVIINKQKNLIFAEYLLNGEADLFYYRDELGTYYFIEKEGVEIQELAIDKNVLTTKEGTYIQESKKYIYVLKYMLNDCKDIEPQIQNVDLNRRSLVSITKKYHDYMCDGEECIIYEKKLPILKIKFAPELGINYWNFKMKNDDIYSNLEFDNTNVFPVIGALWDISFPRWNEKLTLQAKMSFTRYHFYLSTIPENYEFNEKLDFKEYALSSEIGLQYTYPKNKIRPIVGVGVSFKNYMAISGSDNFDIYITNIRTDFANKIFLPNIGLYGKIGFNYHLTNGKVSYIFLNTAICRRKYVYKLNPFTPIKHTAISVLTEFKIGYGIYL